MTLRLLLAAALLFYTAFAAPLFPPGPLPLRTNAPTASELEQGRQLAEKLCVNCHRFAEPSLLDRRTWHGGTEPMMRRILGVSGLDSESAADRALAADWRTVWDWYFHLAPTDMAPPPAHPALTITLTNFAPEFLPYRMTNKMVSLVKIDPARHRLYVGNAETKTLDVLDPAGRLLSSLPVESPPVGLVERPDGWYAPLIWNLAPHTTRQGKLVRLEREGDAFTNVTDVLTGLPRPTAAAVADLNGDGREDIVTCGFGHVEGAFSWWESTGKGYTEHILLERPGATMTEVADLNHDGRPDLVVQMAQAQEGLYWFENLGGGRFEPRVIAEFPPVWGGARFQLVDFDGDGDLDLLAANGDTGEYTSAPRPYHGLRLYLNEGERTPGAPPKFREAWFYPLPGAYDVRAADLDGDGDLDLAAISFFPDYANRREGSFAVFWNDGNLKFRPETLDAGMSGRWLVMDVGDLDGDGRPDIVLGAANRAKFDVPPALKAAWEARGPTVLLLRNLGK